MDIETLFDMKNKVLSETNKRIAERDCEAYICATVNNTGDDIQKLESSMLGIGHILSATGGVFVPKYKFYITEATRSCSDYADIVSTLRLGGLYTLCMEKRERFEQELVVLYDDQLLKKLHCDRNSYKIRTEREMCGFLYTMFCENIDNICNIIKVDYELDATIQELMIKLKCINDKNDDIYKKMVL